MNFYCKQSPQIVSCDHCPFWSILNFNSPMFLFFICKVCKRWSSLTRPVTLAFCDSCENLIACHLIIHHFLSLWNKPDLRGTIFYGWPDNKSVASFLFSLLVCCSGDNSPTLNSLRRFYVLSVVSIVSPCIDVACHVNMHFGVSTGENKEALFHNICICIIFLS